MKSFVFLCIVLAGVSAGCGVGGDTASRPVSAPDETFADLDPYGVWMDVAGLGRVWQPAVSYDWRPFGDGQWVWTDRGWMWASDEPFGWVVYHYGYWSHWGAAGWLWVPGYEWSPARVHWYSGREYIGWAPLPPPGIAAPQAYEQENLWVVVPANDFTREHVGRYRTPTQRSILAPEKEEQRAPDAEFIRRSTRQDIKRWRTESEDIRHGERVVTRVRVRDEAPPGAVTPPPPVVTPPPAARPSPGTRQGDVRRSGDTRAPDSTRSSPGATTRRPGTTAGTPGATTRTPGSTRATPAQPATPKAVPGNVPRPGARDGVRARPQSADSARTRAPRR